MAAALLECQLKHCVKEKAEADKLTKTIMDKVKILVVKMMNGKMKPAEFKIQADKIMEGVYSSKCAKDFGNCTIKQCLPQFKAMMSLASNKLSKVHSDKINKLLAKDPFTIKEYIEILKCLVASTQK